MTRKHKMEINGNDLEIEFPKKPRSIYVTIVIKNFKQIQVYGNIERSVRLIKIRRKHSLIIILLQT